MFDKHWVRCAFALAFDNAGSNIAASIAMMAITTKSSISVKPKSEGKSSRLRDERLLLTVRFIAKLSVQLTTLLIHHGCLRPFRIDCIPLAGGRFGNRRNITSHHQFFQSLWELSFFKGVTSDL